MLDQLIPQPRSAEVDHVIVGVCPERVWELLRHGDLVQSDWARALFALRTLPERLRGKRVSAALRLDELRSTPERPGFQLLGEEPPRELVVGAIGKVWRLEIPFVHVADRPAYRAFAEPGFVKVAWAIRVRAWGAAASRVELEVRVDATDEPSWRRFRRYFRVVGPASRLIRRTQLAALARELGAPEARADERGLPGDERLPGARTQITQGRDIDASPDAIWPWLLMLGCRRGGFYAIDLLDNGGVRSARELRPELLSLEVGQVLPGTPGGEDGFEVLQVEPNRVLLLGGLYDVEGECQLPFAAERPRRYWHITWVFALEPLDARTTRLHVRARAAFPPTERWRAIGMAATHRVMQAVMLRHLAARAEGRLPRDDVRDVIDGLGGAAVMARALLSPFQRKARARFGVDENLARRAYPGDELVPEPRWGWTHGVEIDAPTGAVWPWIAQIGADRAGFYSYQWLENLFGCEIRNAEAIHPEWEAQLGQPLVLHPGPRAPRLAVTSLDRGRFLLARSPEPERREGSWVTVTWLFFLEPLAGGRCRLISRFRLACSGDWRTRLGYGPALVEPIGFAMDRRLLLGVKERAERASRTPVAAPRRRFAPCGEGAPPPA